MMNIATQIARLKHQTPQQLRDKYLEVFGDPTRSGNKANLIKRIAWRLQANKEGDLPQRARRRAAELARDADLRLNPPRVVDLQEDPDALATGSSSGQLMPGTVLRRDYKGRTILVTVLEKGFEYEGEAFRSLSAVAKAVTGSHWNGRLFFGLTGKGQA